MNWRWKSTPPKHHVHAEDFIHPRLNRGRRASDLEPRGTRVEIHPLWIILLSTLITITGFLGKSAWTDMLTEVRGVRSDLNKVLNNQTHTDDSIKAIQDRQDTADAERAKLKDRMDYLQGYTMGKNKMMKQLNAQDQGSH